MPLRTTAVRGLLALACGGLIAVTAACAPGTATDGRTDPARADAPATTAPPAPVYDATVTVNPSGNVIGKTNNSFEGLSFESGRLGTGWFDNVGNLAQLLRNLGTPVLRFGGNSVDTSYNGIKPATLAALARLGQATGGTVLFSEPLAHFNAGAVTKDARAVATALGPRLAGFACGNEPDLYRANGLRSPSYAEGTYLAQVNQCFRAIRAGAPGALLEGPDLSGSPDWLGPYAAAERGTIGWLGQHQYPLGCEIQGDPPGELADELLSPALAAKENKVFDAVTTAARSAGADARLTETSSACDGGGDGISNTFATALWVTDYLLNGAEHGIDGMNFHGGLAGGCQYFTPLCRVSGDEIAPEPIYYGMLFTHMFGNGRLVPATATGKSALNLSAFALLPYSGGLRVLVENMDASRAATSVHVGTQATSASALTMTAPSVLATSGVRIQGAQVAANGTFTAGPPTPVACPGGTCRLTIQPYSAVMLTVGS